MKNILLKLFLVCMLFLGAGTVSVYAKEFTEAKKQKKSIASQNKADSDRCRRASSTMELSVNNVRTVINGNGNMWVGQGRAFYFVPSTGNSTALYCGALWVGGKDENDQLRVAAITFGAAGDDFWPGPLSADGMASTNQSICTKWDQHYRITKSEVQAFIADPSKVTDIIKNWPAHGTEANQSRYIAPFFDKDGDGVYDYAAGDYPYYDFDNELCPKILKANLPPGGKYTPSPTLEDSINKTQDGHPLKPTVTGGLLVDQVLKGDQTIFWVFNDNGNAHTESGSPNSIGLEIRAQAFAFTTNDEINNMTFYSYEIINRSSYTINNTYFSQWVDADLGYAFDDYVGCDVKRGLGYCYNGKATDGPGDGAYPGNPPAVGIDFFQGPYMDPDGKDNPKIDIEKMKRYYASDLAKYVLRDASGKVLLADTVNRRDTIYDTIQLSEDADNYFNPENGGAWYFKPGDYVNNCAINGVNFGNGIVDDERFGMRRFVYYNIGNDSRNGDPSKAQDYYNYLSGFWKDNRRMTFGGNGYGGQVECDFMFPAKTDPWNWGTNGVVPSYADSRGWTEEAEGNSIGDRRFMQSAGPFTLKPGAVNYITVGIPWAKASSGGPYASVELLRQVDDKCQALFDNCFKLLEGPDAPTLIVQEMSNQVILYLSYQNTASNNYAEKYSEIDQRIPKIYESNELESQDTIIGSSPSDPLKIDTAYINQKYKTVDYTPEQRSYVFEGYQIYQLKDATVSVADIYDLDKARLVVQCDVENYYDAEKTQPIGQLINYEKDNNIGAIVPKEKVRGLNKGVKHSFVVNTDLFATTTNTKLVNNKKYYYIAIAYAQNRYKAYDPTNQEALDGQKEPYLAGRKNEAQGAITPVEVIPHDPTVENGGTIIQAPYGTSPEITRIAGHGNGGIVLELTEESKNGIMSLPFNDFGMAQYYLNPIYQKNAGPVNIKVVDPLNVKEGQYYISFTGISDTSRWYLTRKDGSLMPVAKRDATGKVERDPATNSIIYQYVDTIKADTTLGTPYEQLFLDLGISISISNVNNVATKGILLGQGANKRFYSGGGVIPGALLSSSITFSNPASAWLTGRADFDNVTRYNWVRSGGTFETSAQNANYSAPAKPSYQDSLVHVTQDYYYRDSADRSFAPISLDVKEEMEGIILASRGDGAQSGCWAPYKLVSNTSEHPAFSPFYYAAPTITSQSIRALADWQKDMGLIYNDMNNLASVDIVFTNDKSKWSRCPVIEMASDPSTSEGQAKRFQLRKHASVGKDGQPDGTGTGMGWFPGYVINVETGERLNIFFGEDSWLSQHNGRDMLWNPVSGSQDDFGGKHYLYILGNNDNISIITNTTTHIAKSVPYDEGKWAYEQLRTLDNLLLTNQNPNNVVLAPIASLFANVMWVGMPLISDVEYVAASGQPIKIPTETTIRIRVRKPYEKNYTNNDIVPHVPVENGNNPKYMFGIGSDMITLTNQIQNNKSIANQLLDKITVVPNPYYARSEYELAQLDNRVRITNLPAKSRVTIYTPDGTLVRRFDSPDERYETYQLDWDLKNQVGIPIAGGVYLIYVSAPGVGEKVIKWFGALRPIDLNSYQF